VVASNSNEVKVLVDWDSTINDFDGAVIASLNEKFGSTYVVGDMKTWEWLRELDPEHMKHTWGDSMFRNYRWTMAIPPLEGAAVALRKLMTNGFTPRIVTARDQSMKGWVEDWLRINRFPKIKVTYNHHKVQWAERYGYTVAVEDAPHHVLEFADANMAVYMIDKPYNSHIEERWNIVRVGSLLDAVERYIIDWERLTLFEGQESGGPSLGPVPASDDPVIFQTPDGQRSAWAEDPCY
jgi:hypothetical protein